MSVTYLMETDRYSIVQDWLLWLVMNVFGYAGWFCLCALLLIVGMPSRENNFLSFLLLICLGVITGTAQWLVIRWRIQRARWWILATTFGWPIGIVLGFILVSIVNFLFAERVVTSAGMVFSVLVALGLSLGCMQWFVLRGKVEGAEWWILINIITWTLSGFAGATLGNSLVGLITTLASAESTRGIILVWLLHRPMQASTNPTEISLPAQ